MVDLSKLMPKLYSFSIFAEPQGTLLDFDFDRVIQFRLQRRVPGVVEGALL